MAAKSQSPGIYTDILTEFSQGMNSGVLPQLLPRSQCAFAINVTFRGAFATHRPPYIKMVLAFPSEGVQSAVETGFYQGGGWYRPDFGPLQLVAQISGRLFTFTKTTPGHYTVAEISIPGDLNDATTNQVWMWQAEKWLIITDGSAKLPIFYDGVTSRRSYGPSILIATATDTNPPGGSPPPIGETIDLMLSAPYTGPYDVPVLFNGEFYQPVQNAGPAPSYNVILTNLSDTPGATIPSGSDVVVRSNIAGVLSQAATSHAFGSPTTFAEITINFTASYTSAGASLTFGGINWHVLNNGTNTQFLLHSAAPTGNYGITYPAGTLVSISGNSTPNVIVGTTTSAFTVPAVGATVAVVLNMPYSGAPNQIVWIGNQQYSITSVAPSSPGASLTAINLSDTSTAAYTFPSDILSVPEIPAGRMGAYGMGQVWMSLTDGISFIAGDIVGSAAGTQASDYRDAVLKTTGMTFFGGKFRLPGSGQIINSITFTANLDTSLGQGAVQIGTDSNIFSCLAPFDFQNPPDSRIPILTESLIGFGPLAQNSTVLANSDTLFRNFVGLGSLVLARRDFGEWGNTPISREMTRTFSQDNESLLPYGSAVVFDNRLLDTCAPNVSGQGVFHMGVVALNFDLISSLRGKAPPVFDGLWSGLNALQIINIQSGSEARAFIFGYNITDSKIELYELLKSQDRVYFDNGTIPIKWIIETPIIFNQDIKPLAELVRLTDGELWLQDIVGTVNVKVQYRPDFYSGSHQPGCWEDWTEFQICAEATGTNVRPGYRTRIGLGEPSGEKCQEGNNRPYRVGHFFQLRLEFTGSCKFMALRAEAVVQPQASFAPPICQADDPLCTPNPLLPELVIP